MNCLFSNLQCGFDELSAEESGQEVGVHRYRHQLGVHCNKKIIVKGTVPREICYLGFLPSNPNKKIFNSSDPIYATLRNQNKNQKYLNIFLSPEPGAF